MTRVYRGHKRLNCYQNYQNDALRVSCSCLEFLFFFLRAGKLPPVESGQAVGKQIEDVSNPKQAGLHTNTASRDRASQRRNLCLLLTVKLLVALNLHFTR